jgi:ubiquinone/menaquinone biosynthesis C-methylase UbiE
MEMGKAQLQMVNSRIRQFFQKHYEFKLFKKLLEQQHIDLTGQIILDAGCGSGYSSELIFREFRPQELYAFDLMPEQVERVKQRGLSAHVFVGDVTDTQLPADKFDAVFTFGVFHHVAEGTAALEEMNRVLKVGGVLLGGEPSKEMAGFKWAEFVKDLTATGFRLVESKKIYLGYFQSFLCVKS